MSILTPFDLCFFGCSLSGQRLCKHSKGECHGKEHCSCMCAASRTKDMLHVCPEVCVCTVQKLLMLAMQDQF